MLGVKYLLDPTIQHYWCFAFALYFAGEILSQTACFCSNLHLYKHLTLSGIFSLNLAFLHYSFTEELLLVQVSISIFIILNFFISAGGVEKTEKVESKSFSVYLILIVFLIAELAKSG